MAPGHPTVETAVVIPVENGLRSSNPSLNQVAGNVGNEANKLLRSDWHVAPMV